jgi:hypothetical protein
VPDFYVLKNTQEIKTLGKPGQHVLAASGEHPIKDWLMLGIVTAQTPFGQGLAAGVKKSDLRKATKADIRRAMNRVHPIGGELFIPGRPGLPDVASLNAWKVIAHRQIAAVLASLG